MEKRRIPGVFGKLPSHGDFVMRNLAPVFVNSFDQWLQHYVAGAQEQIGADWLNIYLTSPIWRFALSAGTIDGNAWAGIMMPSVDRVGRYFPLMIAVDMSAAANPLEVMSAEDAWFGRIEDLALRALEGELDLEALLAELADVEGFIGSVYQKRAEAFAPGGLAAEAVQVDMGVEGQSPAFVYGHMLDALLVQSLDSYSVWSTQGSELIDPCLFCSQGLPAIGKMPSMMDGQWQARGWSQPYILSKAELG